MESSLRARALVDGSWIVQKESEKREVNISSLDPLLAAEEAAYRALVTYRAEWDRRRRKLLDDAAKAIDERLYSELGHNLRELVRAHQKAQKAREAVYKLERWGKKT